MSRWLTLLIPAMLVAQGIGCAYHQSCGPAGCGAGGYGSAHDYGCTECGEVGCMEHAPIPHTPFQHLMQVGTGVMGGCGDPYYDEWYNYPPGCDSCNNAAAGQPFTLFSGMRTLWGTRHHQQHSGCSSCEAYPGDYQGETYEVIQESDSIMTPEVPADTEPKSVDPPGPLPGPDMNASRSRSSQPAMNGPRMSSGPSSSVARSPNRRSTNSLR